MPIYEYKCNNCDINFDLFLTVEYRDDLQTCPKCSAKDSTRLQSPVNYQFKGKGFFGKGLK